MGKGARNRLKRKAAEQETLSDQLLAELLSVRSVSDLLTLFERHPTLEHGALNEELHQLASMHAFRVGLMPALTLIGAARTDPETAWADFRRWQTEVAEDEGPLESTRATVTQALADRDYNTVLSLARPAAERARSLGLVLTARSLFTDLGNALFQRPSEDRAGDLEDVIYAFEAALGLGVPDDAATLANLALVYVERVRGDVDENLERARALLREALTRGLGEDRELKARTETNLAMALIRGGSLDRRRDLEEAVALCREALEYRTPARDSVNWAYSMMNLGQALELLEEVDGRSSDEVTDCYEQVTALHAELGEHWLVGSAHHALGRRWLHAASVLKEQDQAQGTDHTHQRSELLRRAHAELCAAERLLHAAPDPMLRGRMLSDLGNVAAELGNLDEAITHDRSALAILRPTASPYGCFGPPPVRTTRLALCS